MMHSIILVKAKDLEVRGLQGLSTESEYGVKDVQGMVDFLVVDILKPFL